jgi:hypothetical protein
VQFDSLLALTNSRERQLPTTLPVVASAASAGSSSHSFTTATMSLLHSRLAISVPESVSRVERTTTQVLTTTKPDRIQFKPGYSRM